MRTKVNWPSVAYLFCAVSALGITGGLLDFPTWLNMLMGGILGWYWPLPILTVDRTEPTIHRKE